MKNLRILLISPKNASGTGSWTYSNILAASLRKIDGLTVLEFSAIADLSEKWDVVHALDLKHLDPNLVSAIRAPLVVDVHDVYWLRGEDFFPTPDLPARLILSAWRRRRYIPILNRAAAVITHSKYVAEKLAHPAAYLVPLAVEPLQPGPPLSERPLRVVFAGRDYFRKGLPVLLAAWRHVNTLRPDATLVIAGREYLHGMLYARLASPNRSVQLLGDISRDALLEEIKRARALALPSWAEAFGMVLIEAMSLKTPVVATRVGGIPEALDEGRAGILIEKGDKLALADGILRCLEPVPDKDLIDMTRRALQTAAIYSADNLVKAVLRVYEEVLRKE